jgi:1,5-anhydro-D-fructose reductase (1,5-anhydro-D-mannitol-forming)
MSSTVGWAVVGSSVFALDYVVPAIRSQPGCAVRAVVSREPGRVRDLLGDDRIAVTSRLADLPGLGVDVVHLVVPNDLHHGLTLECFSLGRHVLVEKPMALSVAQAREMSAAADAAGRVLAVGSCMAWSPALVRAADLLGQGILGAPVHAGISAGFDTGERRGWRQLTPTAGGGGVLNDLGAHAIDAVIRLFGDVEEVAASLRTTLPRHQSDDTASLMLSHATGVTSHLELAFTHGCNHLSVTGTTGRLSSREWLGRRFAGHLVRHNDQADASRFGDSPDEGVDELRGAPVTDVLARQAAEVAAAVGQGLPLRRADVGTALRVMAVIEAAVLSAAAKRAVSLGTG